MFIRIEFEITDNMAWHCIEHLLNAEIRVSKKAVVQLCRSALTGTGNLFQVEPIFDQHPEYRQVDSDLVDEYFQKIWK